MGLSNFVRRGSGRSRFTLIELLMVVLVFMILISMLLPSLRRARAYAREVSCMSNLRQIAIGYKSYQVDNKNSMPYVVSPNSGSVGYFSYLDDFTPIYPYERNTSRVFKCPSTNTPFPSYTDLCNRILASNQPSIDYLCGFDNVTDIELRNSQRNNGNGNNPYSFDPSNPTALHNVLVPKTYNYFSGTNGYYYDTANGNNSPAKGLAVPRTQVVPNNVIYDRYFARHTVSKSILVSSVDDGRVYKETKSLKSYWMLDNTSPFDIVSTTQGDWPTQCMQP